MHTKLCLSPHTLHVLNRTLIPRMLKETSRPTFASQNSCIREALELPIAFRSVNVLWLCVCLFVALAHVIPVLGFVDHKGEEPGYKDLFGVQIMVRVDVSIKVRLSAKNSSSYDVFAVRDCHWSYIVATPHPGYTRGVVPRSGTNSVHRRLNFVLQHVSSLSTGKAAPSQYSNNRCTRAHCA